MNRSLLSQLFALLMVMVTAQVFAVDTDFDGIDDGIDACPNGVVGTGSGPANSDIDGDGCDEVEDTDVDGDGFLEPETTHLCTINIAADTSVRVDAPDSNYNAATFVNSGTPSGGQAREGYFALPLAANRLCSETGSTFPQQVLSINRISADFYFRAHSDAMINLSRVNSAWDAVTLTWNTKPALSTAIGSIDLGIGNRHNTPAVSNLSEMDDIAVGVHHGWVFDNTNDDTHAQIFSTEHSLTSDRPYILLSYKSGSVGGDDVCPTDLVGGTLDTDGDGLCDSSNGYVGSDTDDDNDGVDNGTDLLPQDASESTDVDGDGIGDNADADDDNDGVSDENDSCPLGAVGTGSGPANADRDLDGCDDVLEDTDDDNDGTPDASDTDYDNDGVLNGADLCPQGVMGTGSAPANADADGDGCDDLYEDSFDNDATNSGTADLTVTARCTLLVTGDARVRENSVDSNYGSEEPSFIVEPMGSGGNALTRAYYGVDMTGNCTETGQPLPNGVNLTGAYLRMHIHNLPTNPQALDAYRVGGKVADAWAENTVTWNNQPSAHPNASSSAVIKVGAGNAAVKEWDVLPDVQAFLSGYINNGWRVAPQNEADTTAGDNKVYIYSKEYTDKPFRQPRVLVTYELTVDPDTIGNQPVILPNPTLDAGANNCANGFTVYQMPYGNNKLIVDNDYATDFSQQMIADTLLYADYIDNRFQDSFAWDFMQDIPNREPEIRACGTGNAGTDNAGLGMGVQYWTDSNSDGQENSAEALTILHHERIHQWGYRRNGLFLPANSGGHDWLSGVQPFLNEKLNISFMNEESMAPGPFSHHMYNSAMERYQADGALDWDTYFSDPALADYLAGTAPLTHDVDRQLLISGIFSWIIKAHGEAGLKTVYQSLEAERLSNGYTLSPVNFDLTHAERNEMFLRVISDGLGIDGRGYFNFWKFPISAAMNTYLDGQGYPQGVGVNDIDGDGFTVLQGDFDDGDNTIYPNAPELADGKDNNLDGQIDEQFINEANDGDVKSQSSQTVVTLPFTLRGSASNNADSDAFEFTLAEDAFVTVVIRAVDSASTVVEGGSGKEVHTFVGEALIDGTTTVQPDIHQWQFSSWSAALTAGTHTVEISTAAKGNVPENPGDYVVQVFINDYQAPDMTELTHLADFSYKFYNGAVLNPVFDCATAEGVSNAECTSMIDLHASLGGDNWLDQRGWLATDNVCFWRGVDCDTNGIDYLNLNNTDRELVGNVRSVDWSGLLSLSSLSIMGTNLYGALPSDFGPMALEKLTFTNGVNLCVFTDDRIWFDIIATKTSDLPDCVDADGDGYEDTFGSDLFLGDGSEWADNDSDGTGDNADWDDDNDGVIDSVDADPLDNAIMNEIILPLEGVYKGGMNRLSQQ